MKHLLREKEEQVCIYFTVKINLLSGFAVKLKPED